MTAHIRTRSDGTKIVEMYVESSKARWVGEVMRIAGVSMFSITKYRTAAATTSELTRWFFVSENGYSLEAAHPSEASMAEFMIAELLWNTWIGIA